MNATRVAPVGGRRREGGMSIAPYILILPVCCWRFGSSGTRSGT